MSEDFYQTEPNEWTSWRMAVLMGANSRTYKFALGESLLGLAAEGRTEARLSELAEPYAMGLVRHLADAPQAPEGTSVAETDFLTVAAREARRSVELGRPTDPLLDAAKRSMPAMVMQKFHNLGGGTSVPHRFYELAGTGQNKIVRFTPELSRVATSGRAAGLKAELDARWRIVECAFSAGVGRTLVAEGVAVDLAGLTLTDKRRRRSVTGVTEAVIGFQHGRCLICGARIAQGDDVAVDHVFPHSLMRRLAGVHGWAGPDLDLLWNLAPAHAACNGGKSDRLPTSAELHALACRNEAIMRSPHPLRKTLLLNLVEAGFKGVPREWPVFLSKVQDACR